jgi:hypothetical protein
MNSDTVPPSSQIDPERLTLLLEEAGWRLVGARRGIYNRFAPPDSEDEGWRGGSLLVPLNRGAPEFNELMDAALRQVAAESPRDAWQRVIVPRLRSDHADQFQFRKESAAPAGLISWKQGEELVLSARATLVAGAKAHVLKMRRFSNKLGQFAGRFLDSVLMGQTAIGSYVVTAYAPTDVGVPIIGSQVPGLGLSGVDVAHGRDITVSVARALEATSEAIEHYRRTASMSAFEAGVARGISFELSTSLQGLTKDSDGGDISIVWEDSADPWGWENRPEDHFHFSGADSEVLERAAVQLAAEAEPPKRVGLIGRVHLLTKKELGGPGVFGLETLSGPARRVRVRLLDPAEYHRAVRAHDEDLILAVDGELERDGNLYWLYNASIVADVGHVDELVDHIGALTDDSPDQMSITDVPEGIPQQRETESP